MHASAPWLSLSLPAPLVLSLPCALSRSLDEDRDGRVSFKQLIGRLYPQATPDDVKALMALAQGRRKGNQVADQALFKVSGFCWRWSHQARPARAGQAAPPQAQGKPTAWHAWHAILQQHAVSMQPLWMLRGCGTCLRQNVRAACAACWYACMQEMASIYEIYDDDHDGLLDKEEFISAIQQAGGLACKPACMWMPACLPADALVLAAAVACRTRGGRMVAWVAWQGPPTSRCRPHALHGSSSCLAARGMHVTMYATGATALSP